MVIGIFSKLVYQVISVTSVQQYQRFFGQEVMTSALGCLHDAYHQDIHSEAISLVTHIYSRLMHTFSVGQTEGLLYARQVLQLLPENPTLLDAVHDFEKEFSTKESLRERNVVMRKFLECIQGLPVSQWGRTKPSFVLNVNEKSLLAAGGGAKAGESASLLDKSGDDHLLSSLF